VGAIFQATGRTIQAGKRVSAFSSYANLIKAQLREDIASMSRDGFMVIRNEYADADGDGAVRVQPVGQPNVDAVALYEDDLRPRLRRTDELMFFAKGQFVSARELLDPDFIARADAARIYYGHGQRAVPPAGGYVATDPYYNPDVDDKNVGVGALQGAGRLGYYNALAPVPNPNRFAADWILARQVTLLRPPQSSGVPVNGPAPFSLSAPQLLDSEAQIALQPAASSIFRVLTVMFPQTPPGGVRQSFDAGYDHPQFSSGLVDIAATDLSLIRSIVMTCDKRPLQVNASSFFDPTQNANADGQNAGPDGKFRRYADDNQIMLRMHEWMDEALPTWSTADGGNVTKKTRVRVEKAATNFVGVVSDTALPAVEKASRRADQMMLASSGFLPRCTEFIVEWSFGKQYPSDPSSANYVAGREGQYVWHGLFREVNGQTVANYYLSTDPFEAYSQTYPRNDGSVGPLPPVSTELIHGIATGSRPSTGAPLTSYFGYVDPSFNPDSNANGNLNDPADSKTTTVPWAWPKLLRVTLSLADPNDPSVEQSFQFVFEVPEAK
jgi:hypothetical protein